MVSAGYSSRVASAWDFRLIRSYYQQQGLSGGETSSRGLLNCELIAYLIELLENALSHDNLSNKLLSVFYDSPYRARIQKVDTDDMDLS